MDKYSKIMKIAFSVIVLSTLLACNSNNGQTETKIFFYCAAGIKPAVSMIADEYSKEYNVDIQLQYGGSGTLLSNIRVAKRGDLYLAADQSYIEKAKEYNLIDEVIPVAYLTPVIIVKKGNAKNIKSIKDLLREDVRVAIANPSAASIGRLTKKIFEDKGIWDQLRAHVKVLKPTVNDVANDVKIGSVDAGIVWDATANQYDDLQSIEVPEFNKYVKQVTVAVLKSSKNPTAALRFVRYMTAKDKGLKVFEKFKYKPVDGDIWDENPDIVFYSGGVNRVAVDKAIRAFEKREGVRVTTVYNGCGILVSQIKAGQRPDAYLTCDTSFMAQVNNRFSEIQNVSKTQIVIIADKANTHNIHSLQDLTKKGLKIGVCNPQQSALGTLTARLLKRRSLYESIMKNVRSQTPTADLLVNQMRTGSLDAAIVYMANTSQVKDKFTIIPVENANATQNFGLGVNSGHKNLIRRLFQFIISDSSKKNYLKNGFEWKYQQSKK
jgi:molybdenum ABC transporter molybdate-binding protein